VLPQDGATEAVDAGNPVPSLEELAARAVRVAPGMHELARGEVTLPVSIGLPKVDGDVCVRVAFAGRAPLRAALQTTSGDALVAAEPSTDGLLGPRGPVCVRRGQGVVLVMESAAYPARYVVWVAP
jgi:hypothetical protein